MTISYPPTAAITNRPGDHDSGSVAFSPPLVMPSERDPSREAAPSASLSSG